MRIHVSRKHPTHLLLSLSIAVILSLGISCATGIVKAPNLVERGAKYEDDEKLKTAISYYSKAIEQDSTYLEAYLRRGHAYDKLADPDQAKLDYNHVIAVDSTNAKAWFLRGFSWLVGRNSEDGQSEKAIADITRAIDLGYQESMAYYVRAGAYRSTGEARKAIEDYKKFMFSNRSRSEILMQNAREAIAELEEELNGKDSDK